MNRRPLYAWILLLGGCAAPGPVTSPAPAAAPAMPSPAMPAAAMPVLERPIPYPVEPSAEFQRAIEAGTRTTTGRPGPAYWTNWADYRLRARVLPEAKRLEGSASIRYHNRSPDRLEVLVLDLAQNIHAPGVVRHEPAEVTGGVDLRRVQVRGRTLSGEAQSGPRYVVDGTKLVILPDAPVAPGAAVDLEIDWAFRIPRAGAGARMGHSGEDLLFLAYWYPQLTAYDDVVGWHPDQFTGITEFYNDFANYDLTIEAPEGWLVMSTGELTNAETALAPAVYRRLRAAEASDSVVQVLTRADFGRATGRATGGFVTWTFQADSVRDVAFSVTRESVWDAARTAVGDRNGDGATDYARVDAIYRESAPRWRQVARYAQHSIRFLSQYTDTPYPWSHMTAVEGEGIIGGGMEYPMMTLIGGYTAAGDTALYNVTVHEIAHMWMPMLANTDERRYSWMDEGTTSFNENQARGDFFPGHDADVAESQGYLEVAMAGLEGEIMRRSAYHYPGPAYGVASYSKPAAVLAALRGVLGQETFDRAYREFFDRWAWRHPYPWDLWNTFEDVSGRDLDWFWRTWYHETWILDQAIRSVERGPGGTRIVVEDRGRAPMPVRLTVTLASGERILREIPVESWLAGARTASVTIPTASEVVAVEIDAERDFPDANRANNVWRR